MREEDAVRALETLGLTGKEAAAYLNLQRSGASSAQQVSQLLGVQYPAVYRILQSLQSKGWIDISRERPDLAEISGLLSRNIRVQFHFPSRPLPKTRLAHTYVFPSDEEVFILNSFYRDGEFVSDKLQGLWVGDMDFVRVQLEAMLLDLSEPRARRALPRSRQTG